MGTLMDSLTTKIQRAEQRFDESAQTTVQRAVELGKLLTEAKAKIEHGGWEAWCQKTFAGRRSQSWIQNVMKVARDCEQHPELLRFQSLRAITAASKPEQSKKNSDASSKAQRAVHLETAGRSHESVEEESADAQEQTSSLPSPTHGSSIVSADDTDYMSAAAIAHRIISDVKQLQAVNDPVVAEMMNEVREVIGVPAAAVLTISEEARAIPSKRLRLTADEAIAAIAEVEARLKPGRNDRSRINWHGDGNMATR